MDHKALMKALAMKIRSAQQYMYDPDTGSTPHSAAVENALEIVADAVEELANMTEGEIMYFLEMDASEHSMDDDCE